MLFLILIACETTPKKTPENEPAAEPAVCSDYVQKVMDVNLISSKYRCANGYRLAEGIEGVGFVCRCESDG